MFSLLKRMIHLSISVTFLLVKPRNAGPLFTEIRQIVCQSKKENKVL